MEGSSSICFECGIWMGQHIQNIYCSDVCEQKHIKEFLLASAVDLYKGSQIKFDLRKHL